MLGWLWKHKKWGVPLLLLPLALLLRGFGSLADLFKRPPSGLGSQPLHPFDPQKSEEERERIIDEREAAEEKIVTASDSAKRDIDTWIDKGLKG